MSIAPSGHSYGLLLNLCYFFLGCNVLILVWQYSELGLLSYILALLV